MITFKGTILEFNNDILKIKVDTFYKYLLAFLKTQFGDNEIRVKIIKWKSERTEATSRLFHVMRDKIAKHECVNNELMKNQLKIAYGVSEEIHDRARNKTVTILKSTSNYTWDEMSYLIEMTRLECYERGLDIRSELAEWHEIIKEKEKK